MTYTLGLRSLGNLQGVAPQLIPVIKAGLAYTTQDYGVAGKAVRTAAEQHALYLQGVTQKDGYKNRSNHQPHGDGFGYAVDLTPFIGGQFDVNNEAAQYPIASAISKAAKRCGVRVVWGGNWIECMNDYGSEVTDMKAAVARYRTRHPGPDFIDLPHFQLELS